ncbi:MAG TPA: NAD-dependent epimerase/dehydratase family protein [Bacillota bacterium]|nr:NAD-dependent epimerase/dehydratase family protein [Bacillota bacterium]HQE65788.1 NAD-dependent epimerase/dehydratase family protein [Bacillota bacterium]HQI15328.1 NAD-dependent epimerase/dehydratase family protein [Bacillota bacterium]HQJ36389.1 NAD-dependent epimerase/dehydratase family protein [Bacillota bacterium]HQL37295.1 NAD-dependent epimerase/dehydratase family protein [Bacillota bacterium]
MKTLVTGGAGFIGRWTVKKLFEEGHSIWILDDLSNGSYDNIKEFKGCGSVKFIQGDIKDERLLESMFNEDFDLCFHLAAKINVQDSIDDPVTTYRNDVSGTFNVLEQCRKRGTKMVFMSTCMVYDRASGEEGIDELHPVKPASPYAGSKIAGESLVLSYWHAYKLPAVVIRPFNTFGPFQKSGGEGGVIAIFIKNSLEGRALKIYGDGNQTRDFLYVEDCADFIARAGCSDMADGQIINAGTGKDIAINDLAVLVSRNRSPIEHIPHIHPQSEIQKLLCNSEKAYRLLSWKPQTVIEEGIARTEKWIEEYL